MRRRRVKGEKARAIIGGRESGAPFPLAGDEIATSSITIDFTLEAPPSCDNLLQRVDDPAASVSDKFATVVRNSTAAAIRQPPLAIERLGRLIGRVRSP
jgi:hypothetical protein